MVSNTDPVLTRVETLKESALSNRDFEDYGEAIADLEQAVKMLEAQYINLAETHLSKTAYKRQLADCYGMMGGIYRRWRKLDKAVENYDMGLRYEENDSYNLSNSIVIRLLLNPASLDQQRAAIIQAERTVNAQVQSDRSEQWWAWADLGLFRLLDSKYELAQAAYEKFRAKGAREKDYDSTIKVLSELAEALRPKYSELASKFQKAIQFLKSEKTRNK